MMRRAFVVAEAVIALGLALVAVFLVLAIFLQAYVQTRQFREQANARQAAESWVAQLQEPVREGELEPVVLDSITYRGSLHILPSEPGFYQLQVTTSWPGHERKFPFHYRPSL